ncbi:hypothetical protein [Paraburkholderia sp. J76]|uniref:hypothetical protein n=1 Tax=Paraburkholderia sp. J76 TaxID=2805439 RepID=UPI002ABE0C66|nr:hypothetical protein [Paraburkholderia sp. J76]
MGFGVLFSSITHRFRFPGARRGKEGRIGPRAFVRRRLPYNGNDKSERPGPDPAPYRPRRSDMMLTLPIFLIAFFAIVVAMHRGVTRRADAKLRAQFDSQGLGGEVSRQLMRDSGYSV